jgi:predicted RNA methylase
MMFTHYDIEWCLYDERRLRQYQAAIQKKSKDKVVVDIGAGTGVLSLFAAQAGARRVYAIEINPRAAGIIAHHAERNGFGEIIQVIHGDGMAVELPEKADLIVSEMMSCGLFYEPQIQVMNNAKRFLKPGGQFIPEDVESHVELIAAETHSYGLRFDYVDRSTALPGDTPLTDRALYHHPRFAEETANHIEGDVMLTGSRNGVANAVRITGRAKLAEGIYTGQTTSLFNPLVVFLKQPVAVTAGQSFRIRLSYVCGSDTLDARIAVDEAVPVELAVA